MFWEFFTKKYSFWRSQRVECKENRAKRAFFSFFFISFKFYTIRWCWLWFFHNTLRWEHASECIDVSSKNDFSAHLGYHRRWCDEIFRKLSPALLKYFHGGGLGFSKKGSINDETKFSLTKNFSNNRFTQLTQFNTLRPCFWNREKIVRFSTLVVSRYQLQEQDFCVRVCVYVCWKMWSLYVHLAIIMFDGTDKRELKNNRKIGNNACSRSFRTEISKKSKLIAERIN